MNKNIYIEIKVYDKELFLTRIINKKIKLNNISYSKNTIRCFLSLEDYEYIKKYYKVKVIKSWNLYTLKSFVANKLIYILSLTLAIVTFLIISNLIVAVNTKSINEDFDKRFNKALEREGIKHLSFKKKFTELEQIKNKLMNEFNNEIEWLEIKIDGMKYDITLEERKIIIPNKTEEYCNVVAKKDGIVTKVISSSGVVLVNKDTYVRNGDVLISGDVTYNNEIKETVCAKGTVYGEVWYNVKLSIPKTYQEKKYTNKYRYNLGIENNNIDYKIFKSRLKNYDTDYHTIFSFLGKKINILKEYEYVFFDKEYTENELDNKINSLIEEKLNLNLSNNERILYKNVLKKNEINSTIDIEAFVTVEMILGTN